MAEKRLKELKDTEIKDVSGGKSEKNPSDVEPLTTGKCYCGHTENLSGISSKKMFMNAGLKKEWKCPQCGRSNVERDFKWTKIFVFK